MKAQLSFDFYFSLIVFIVFVASLFFKLITFFPLYSEEVSLQKLRAEAYQISEILVNDAGYPGNWHTDVPNTKRLGLSDEIKNKTNILSASKITAFDSLCNSAGGYNKVLELLDIKDGFLTSFVDKSIEPNVVLMTCLPPEAFAKLRVEINRTVAFGSGAFGELRVSMWKI